MKKVVIIGGGNGTYVLTNILKSLDLELTKIVTVFDSGGSTARLKDEFGFLPVGDLRQSLAALATENGQEWIRDLLLYRFDRGEGLKGHNLGNLILTALQDMTGSTPKALEVAAKSFRLQGNIFPVTTDKSELKTIYADGSSVVGEHELDEPENGGKQIDQVTLTSDCLIYEKARESIEQADYVVIGPGDLYASILPNFIVNGAKEAFQNSSAQLIYVVNLMTRYTQTHGYTAKNHVEEVEKYIGKSLDYVFVNTGDIDPDIAEKYANAQEFPVDDDLGKVASKTIIRKNFASSKIVEKQKQDKLPRALMRHNPEVLKKTLQEIIMS